MRYSRFSDSWTVRFREVLTHPYIYISQIKPEKYRHISHRSHNAALRRQNGQEPHPGDESLDEELYDVGSCFFVRDQTTHQFVESAHVKNFGCWTILTVRTEFASQTVRVICQTPHNNFGRVLWDSFTVQYIGPSILDRTIDHLLQTVSRSEDRTTSTAVQLGIVRVEDLLTPRGALFKHPVLCKVNFRKVYVGQTSSSADGTFNASFRLPVEDALDAPSPNELGDELLIEVLDDYSMNLVGELRLRASDVLHHTPSPRLHPIFSSTRQHQRRKWSKGCGGPLRKGQHHGKIHSEESPFEQGTGDEVDAPLSLGRIMISVCRADDALDDAWPLQEVAKAEATDGAAPDVRQLRDGLFKRHRPTMRQVLRLSRQEKNSEVETLMLKGNLIKSGLAEAAISLIPDESLGPQAAEFLLGLIDVSEEVLLQTGGGDVRARMRDVLHNAGVGRASWMMARARARSKAYDVSAASNVLVTPVHFDLIAEIYIRNRRLLHELILDELSVFEMITRGIPYPAAEALLMEVGLGKTLPPSILGEYLRLRRVLPLDRKFWTCPALKALPLEMPRCPDFMFECDRREHALPPPPPPTCQEALHKRAEKYCMSTFNFTLVASLIMAIFSLLKNQLDCHMTVLMLSLSSGVISLRVILNFIRRMRDQGIGSQV